MNPLSNPPTRTAPTAGHRVASKADQLFAAVRGDNLGRIMAMLYTPGHADIRSAEGHTLLMEAVLAAVPRRLILTQLIKDGVDPHATAPDGTTALLKAAKLRTPYALETVETLLNVGVCNPHHVDRQGRNALHHAVVAGIPSVVEALMAATTATAALTNAMDRSRQTPLMLCAASPALALMLLAAGADPRIKDVAGKSAFDRASDRTLRALMQATAVALDKQDAAAAAALEPMHDDIATATAMARAFLQPTPADTHGRTAIALAVLNGDLQALQTALADPSGSEHAVNQADAAGKTPLMYAANVPQLAVPLLLAGADPRIQDHDGASSLDLCNDPTAEAAMAAMARLLTSSAGANVPPAARQAAVSAALAKAYVLSGGLTAGPSDAP